MSSRFLGLAVMVGIGAGCLEPSTIEGEIPLGVDWITAVTRTEGGTFGTALVSSDQTAVIAAKEATFLLGYSHDSIMAAAGELAGSLSKHPLEEAGPCEPSLPEPIWTAKVSESSLTDAPPTEELPRLTSAWVAGHCPQRELALELDCRHDIWCDRTFQSTGSCGRLVEQRACNLPDLTLLEDWGGRVGCIQTGSEETLSTSFALPAEFTVSTSSEECSAKVHALGTEPPWEDRYDFGPHLPFEPPPPREWVMRDGPMDVPRLSVLYIEPHGSAFDFLLLPDRAVISAGNGTSNAGCGGTPSTLIFLGLDPRLEHLGTSTAPPCLVRLAQDPGRDGFLGVYKPSITELRLARFDRSGRLERSVPIAIRDVDVVGAMAIVMAQSEVVVAVAYLFPNPGRRSEGGMLTYHDLESLEEKRRQDSRTEEPVSVRGAIFVEPHVVVSDDAHNLIHMIDSAVAGWEPVGSVLFPSGSVGAPYFDRLTKDLVLPHFEYIRGGSLYFYPEGAPMVALANYYIRDHFPIAVGPWADGHLAVILAAEGDSPLHFDTHLALVDPETHRYLPYTAQLGSTAASRLLARGDGDLFVLLPDESTLLRIRAEPP